MPALATTTTVQLSGPLTIAQGMGIRSSLQTALDSGQDIVLELDNNTGFDLAMVQLLCAAHLSAIQRGQKLWLPAGLPADAQQLLQQAGFAGRQSCAAHGDQGCLLDSPR